MSLLLDTNIFLEVLLGQERAEEARQLLSSSSQRTLYLSDFTLFSIGLKLFRSGTPSAFVEFVNDIVLRGIVIVATVSPDAAEESAAAATRFALGFDDASQYTVAKHLDAATVSFDRDFDRTERGRKTPANILAERGEAPSG
jgi:predicted nucleic acid-binding protein